MRRKGTVPVGLIAMVSGVRVPDTPSSTVCGGTAVAVCGQREEQRGAARRSCWAARLDGGHVDAALVGDDGRDARIGEAIVAEVLLEAEGRGGGGGWSHGCGR